MSRSDVIPDGESSRPSILTHLIQAYKSREKSIDYDALTQFIEGLRSDLDLAQNHSDSSEQGGESIASVIANKLDEASNPGFDLERKWNLAYHAEKLLLSLFGAERQKIELYRRLGECQRINAPFCSFYEEQIKLYETEILSDNQCFNLLVSLVRDMQHHNSNKHIKMRYARHAIYRVGLAFSLALFLFLSIISLFHWT